MSVLHSNTPQQQKSTNNKREPGTMSPQSCMNRHNILPNGNNCLVPSFLSFVQFLHLLCSNFTTKDPKGTQSSQRKRSFYGVEKYIIFLFLIVCLTAGTECCADEEPARRQIQQWVQQLGHDSFLVRQRAEALLIRTGIQAYPDLRRAKQNPDIEIVRRAEYILSQIEQTFFDMENREAAFWILLYIRDPNPVAKARTIWMLADPVRDLVKGEGLQTLCRLVRFEENSALRLEAAKSLIASPPTSPVLRQKWYQSIRDSIDSAIEDDLLRCVTDYAKLWCALDEAGEKITMEYQERVRQVSAETLRLLERPENRIQTGSKIDILLHYAVAELQDAAGLIENRDTTVAAALAIEPGPLQTAEPLMQQFNLEDDLLLNEHYYTGLYLKQRYRLRWAIAHFQKVMADGDVALRILASRNAAESAMYLDDYASAIAFFDKHIEIFQGPDHARNDAESMIALAQRRQAYCMAEQAAAVENWEQVREAIWKVWAAEPSDNHDRWDDEGHIDLVIMAHRLCKQLPGIDDEFKEMLDGQLRKTWKNIVADYDNATFNSSQIKMVIVWNWGAWLLANTDGDYPSALTLVEAALKVEPDDTGILDTLAHVYFLGGKVDEAIRVQEQVVRFAPEAAIYHRALERFKKGKERVSAGF